MDPLRQQADELRSQAFHAHMRGDLDRALDLYSQSIACCPTAEAYTYRGWAYSFQGNYDRAIAECLRAIDLDPDFGNPYNDIGAYLIETGRLEEAVPWLHKATQARRYSNPCFPVFNLGRVCERQRRFADAREHYMQALAINPEYTPARRALGRLRAQWN